MFNWELWGSLMLEKPAKTAAVGGGIGVIVILIILGFAVILPDLTWWHGKYLMGFVLYTIGYFFCAGLIVALFVVLPKTMILLTISGTITLILVLT